MTKQQLVLSLAMDELHENWPNKPMTLDEVQEMRNELAELIKGYKGIVYQLNNEDFIALVEDCK